MDIVIFNLSSLLVVDRDVASTTNHLRMTASPPQGVEWSHDLVEQWEGGREGGRERKMREGGEGRERKVYRGEEGGQGKRGEWKKKEKRDKEKEGGRSG